MSSVESCQSFQVNICEPGESCSGVAMYSATGDTGNDSADSCSDGIIEEITEPGTTVFIVAFTGVNTPV